MGKRWYNVGGLVGVRAGIYEGFAEWISETKTNLIPFFTALVTSPGRQAR